MSLLINKLDYYVAKKTASRLNLYVKQEDRLHNEVERLFDDVKVEVTIIRSAINAFPNKEKRITSDDVDTFVKTLKPKVGTILEKSSLMLSSFLSDLSKKQQELFLQDLEKKNKKTLKALKKNKYFEKTADRLEMLLGKLSAKQRLIIKKHRYSYKRLQEKLYDVDLNFHKALKAVFKVQNKKERIEQMNLLSIETVRSTMATLDTGIFNDIVKSYFLVLKDSSNEQRETLDKKKEFLSKILNNFIKNKYSN